MAIRTFNNNTPKIGSDVYIDPSALLIGDVTIGEDSSIWPFTVVRGDMHKIRIGNRCSIQDGSVLHITHAGPYNLEGSPLIIGNDVTVGHRVVLHGCTISDRILIGMGAIIMDNVIIEPDIIIGAGTVVPPGKILESGHLYVGSPAKKIRKLTSSEKSFLRYTAANYVKLKDTYLSQS